MRSTRPRRAPGWRRRPPGPPTHRSPGNRRGRAASARGTSRGWSRGGVPPTRRPQAEPGDDLVRRPPSASSISTASSALVGLPITRPSQTTIVSTPSTGRRRPRRDRARLARACSSTIDGSAPDPSSPRSRARRPRTGSELFEDRPPLRRRRGEEEWRRGRRAHALTGDPDLLGRPPAAPTPAAEVVVRVRSRRGRLELDQPLDVEPFARRRPIHSPCRGGTRRRRVRPVEPVHPELRPEQLVGRPAAPRRACRAIDERRVARKTRRPPGRRSRAASGIQRYGSAQMDAPYSETARSKLASGSGTSSALASTSGNSSPVSPAAPRGLELRRGDVDADRPRTTTGEPRRDVRRAAAELDHVHAGRRRRARRARSRGCSSTPH